MLNSLILFAQAEDKAQEGFGGLPLPVVILAIAALFFFLIILPNQRRQKKEQETLMNTLKKNDEVVTTGGIIGIVHLIHEGGEQVTLKIDDNGARMRVLRSSIARILTPPAPAAAPTTPAAPPSANGIINKPNA
jgi:preprotein translocase subunit YajC